MGETSDRIRAIDRAIDVLECFAAERRALSIGDIEKRSKLSRPTLYRILATLIRRGLVRKDGEPPRYRLDIGIGRLAEVWTNSLDVVQLATPILNDLLDRHDETVALYLRKDNTRLCVAELPSRQALSYSRGLGYSGSLLRGASGLAILANIDPADAARIIAAEANRVDAKALRGKLADVSRSGFALSGGDFIVGAQAIASPVFDRQGLAIGSLGLFGPSARFPAKRVSECAKAVKASAAVLSAALGYRPRDARA
jgi:IclR family transcriptional regulator, acetate operon repressor